MTKLRQGAAAIAVAAGMAADLTYAQTPPNAPHTPGTVALLANRLDGKAIDELRDALHDTDPVVRATAARVIGIAKIAPLASVVAEALDREQDETTAAEMLRALIFMETEPARAALKRYLPRGRGPAVRVYLEWLARGRIDRTAAAIEEVFAIPDRSREHITPLVARIILRNRADAERLLRAWLRVASPFEWSSVLNLLGGDLAASEVPVLKEALASPNADIREETVWEILHRIALGLPVAPATLDAALPSDAAGGGQADATPELLGREMIARRHRKAQTPARTDLLKRTPRDRQRARLLLELGDLQQSERDALRAIAGPDGPDLSRVNSVDRVSVRRDGQPSMRTLARLPPGALGHVLTTSRCGIHERARFAVFEVRYRADGRPASVNVDKTGLSDACFDALAALGRLTIADAISGVVEGQIQTVVVPMHKDYAACLAAAPSAPPRRVDASGEIQQPRKIHDVRPAYPEGARLERIQGTVVLEAIIRGTGCITDLVVLASVHPSLDYQAVQAVSQWRFTPTLLEGQPVPVIMTVTVNFTLQ